MKHKKVIISCLGCALVLFVFLGYNSNSTQEPTVTNQMFAIETDGSMREIEGKTMPVDDFQLSLEAELEDLEGVDKALVTCGREDETAYRVTVLGQQVTDIEDDILSYLEQLDGYSVSGQTSYDNRIDFDLTSQ